MTDKSKIIKILMQLFVIIILSQYNTFIQLASAQSPRCLYLDDSQLQACRLLATIRGTDHLFRGDDRDGQGLR